MATAAEFYDEEEYIPGRELPLNISEDEGVTMGEPPVRDTRLRGEVLASLHEGLAKMYREEEFTDLEVKVQNKVFKCHKVIMVALSGYFRSLLSSGMRESQDGQVELKGVQEVVTPDKQVELQETVSEGVFYDILQYIYYGENIISPGTVQDLLAASVLLQIRTLERECVEFMSQGLRPSNCISIWRLAKAHGCVALTEQAFKVILKNFEEVSQNEDFISLDKDNLISILDDEQLCQQSEDPICEAVLEWVQTDPGSREQYLEELLQFVCLPKVSGPFLYDRLLDKDLMDQHPKFKDMVMDALCYHLKPDQKQYVMSKQTKLRNDPNFKKVLTLLGGYYMEGETLSCVLCFDFDKERWYTVASIPHETGEDFATCVYQNEIFISGGSRNLDKFAKYIPNTNDWITQPSLLTGRECHSMVVIGDSIYFLGGRNAGLDSDSKLVEDIEVYDNKTGRWARVGKFQFPVESCSAVIFKDKIYTFGGLGEEGENSSAIQCFDPSNGTCTLVGSLPSPSSMTSAVVMNKNVYVVCPEGKVYRFDEADAITAVAEFTPRSKFGLYADNPHLVIVGGETGGEALTDEVMKVDVRSGKVTSAKKLPIPFCGFRMESIVVPKKFLAQEGFNVQGQNLFDPELEFMRQENLRRQQMKFMKYESRMSSKSGRAHDEEN